MNWKTAACLFTTLFTLSGAPLMASSLRLASPAELAGPWQFYAKDDAQKPCTLILQEQDGQLAGDLACAGHWLGGTPATWYPTPDGLALVDNHDELLVHMGRQREGFYMAQLPDGRTLFLQREPASATPRS